MAERPVHVEALEGRRLLSAFAANISFQPANTSAPTGYVADNGAVYADRGNGMTYGWNSPKPAQVMTRHGKNTSSDQRLDSFAILRSSGKGSRWQISVADGTYNISLTAGDPTVRNARYRVMVDGVLVVDGKATPANRWVSGTKQLSVSNGLLTLTATRGRSSKLDFIDIQQIVLSSQPPAPTNLTAVANADGTIKLTWTPSTGASDYRVERLGPGDNGFREIATGITGNSFTDTGLSADTTYQYRVRAENASGLSDYSPVASATTPAQTQPPPPPPKNPLDTALTWNALANAPIGLAEAQSITFGGRLYVFGGYYKTTPDYQPTTASEVFDPSANAWISIAPMPAAETHMGVATDGTYIYVAGGYTFDPKTTYQTFGTTNVFRYNPVTNVWSNFVSLPAPRAAGALVYLDGQLHFFDGVDPTRGGQTTHWIMNLSDSNPQWTISTPLPFSRNHMVGTVLDAKIYAIGGQSTSDDSSTTSDCLMWDPANPSVWTRVASLPVPLSHAVVVTLDDRIVVAGGTTKNDVPLFSVYVYNPTTNVWTTQTSLPNARLAAVGGVIGNQILVTTGFGNNALQSQTWVATVA
jgi:N-acetylneuraminic acid mutarotase